MVTKTLTEWFRLTKDLTYGEWTKISDTYIASGAATTNYGNGTRLIVADAQGANTRRALIEFEIPPQSKLGDADLDQLYLYLCADGAGGGAGRAIIYDVTPNFIEGTGQVNAFDGADWNTYDGVTGWAGGAGAIGAGSVGQVWGNIGFGGGFVAWDTWNLTQLIRGKGYGPGSKVRLLIKWTDETAANKIVNYHSSESATGIGAGGWPAGAPWAGGGAERFRPVLKVVYIDEKPAAVNDFKVEPWPEDPALAMFTWGKSTEKFFTAYAIRYKNDAPAGHTPVLGSDALVNLYQYGANKLNSAGFVTARTASSGAGVSGMGDRFYYRLFVEDDANIDAEGSPSPEVSLVRPYFDKVSWTGRRASTDQDLPDIRLLSNLNASSGNVGETFVMAISGIGDLLENDLIKQPLELWTYWEDDTPVQKTRVYGTTLAANRAHDNVDFTVLDPTVFIVGKAYMIINSTLEYDIIRITAISGTTITFETDLAEAGRVADSLYFDYLTGDPVYGPLPEHIYTKAKSVYHPAGRILNSGGWASDVIQRTANNVSVGVVAGVPRISSNLKEATTTDEITFYGGDSFPQMSDKPITLWKFNIDAVETSETVPYKKHTHGSAGTCTAKLRVSDGTNQSGYTSDLTVTVVAPATLALNTGLVNKYIQRHVETVSGVAIEITEGVDVREFVYVGDGKSLLKVNYIVKAVTDTDADGNPDDLEALLSAWTGKKNLTDSLPTGTGMATYTGKLMGKPAWGHILGGMYEIRFQVVYTVLV